MVKIYRQVRISAIKSNFVLYFFNPVLMYAHLVIFSYIKKLDKSVRTVVHSIYKGIRRCQPHGKGAE